MYAIVLKLKSKSLSNGETAHSACVDIAYEKNFCHIKTLCIGKSHHLVVRGENQKKAQHDKMDLDTKSLPKHYSLKVGFLTTQNNYK